MKMRAWDVVEEYIERRSPSAKYTKWLLAGGMAGVATTVVGELIHTHIASSKDVTYTHDTLT